MTRDEAIKCLLNYATVADQYHQHACASDLRQIASLVQRMRSIKCHERVGADARKFNRGSPEHRGWRLGLSDALAEFRRCKQDGTVDQFPDLIITMMDPNT